MLTMMFAAVTAVFRLFPPLGSFLRAVLVAFLVVSARFYYLLITALTPSIKRWLDINVLEGLWRPAATMVLSLAIGSLVLLLVGWGVGILSLLCLAIHGLLVGLLWDELMDDASLQMGVKM